MKIVETVAALEIRCIMVITLFKITLPHDVVFMIIKSNEVIKGRY